MPNHTQWNVFIQKVDAFIASKRFSISEFEECLRVLNPKISLSLWARFLSASGLFYFQSARKRVLLPLFRSITQDHFAGAPKEAFTAYEKLLRITVPKDAATLIAAIPQTVLAKDIGQLTLEMGRFADLAFACNELKKNAYTMLGEGKKEQEEKSRRIEKTYQERVALLKEIENEQKKIGSAVPLRAVPALFFAKEESRQKWEKVLSQGLPQFDPLPAIFTDEKTFQEYVKTQQEKIAQAKKTILFLSFVKTFSDELDLFVLAVKNVLPDLYTQYVEAFIAECEKRMLEGEVDLKPLLEQQKRELFSLDKKIVEMFTSLKKRAVPFYEELLIASLSVYKDLPEHVNALMKPNITEALVVVPILTQEVSKKVLDQVHALIEKRFQGIQKVIEKGKERDAKLQEIVSFIEHYQKLLEPLFRYKEFRNEYEKKKSELSSLHLPKKKILEIEPHAIEGAIEKRYEEYKTLQKESAQFLTLLSQRCLDAEKRCKISKLRLKRRLCEFFSEITPYPDLKETLASCRKLLESSMRLQDEQFYRGKVSSAEYEVLCNDLAYEHDVKLVRNELAFRATRLREARFELLRLISELAQTRRLLGLIAGVQEIDLYKSVLELLHTLQKLLRLVENPFMAFEGCFDGEQVSRKFRSFWLEIEEIQEHIQKITPKLRDYLELHKDTIKSRFLKACDDLEEVMRLTTGSRPDIVIPYERELSLKIDIPTLFACLHEVEKKFPFVRPFAFFMAIPDFRVRQKLFQEAKKLHERLDALYSFAKTLQQIKTFEEERIDDILDFFERRYILEEKGSTDTDLLHAWENFCHRMEQVQEIIEEEVLFDIGFIDRKGLMDINHAHEKQLENILQSAQTHARLIAARPQTGLADRLVRIHAHPPYTQESPMLCRTLFDETQTSISHWLSSKNAPSKQDLEDFCAHLFLVKCMEEVQKDNPLASLFLLKEEMHVLAQIIEKWLQDKRKAPLLSNPWIEECFRLRCFIECCQPTDQEITDFINTLSSIPEITLASPQEKEKLFIESSKEELIQHSRDITKKMQLATFRPFFYLPGCL